MCNFTGFYRRRSHFPTFSQNQHLVTAVTTGLVLKNMWRTSLIITSLGIYWKTGKAEDCKPRDGNVYKESVFICIFLAWVSIPMEMGHIIINVS